MCSIRNDTRLLVCSVDRSVSVLDARSGDVVRTYEGRSVKGDKGITYINSTTEIVDRRIVATQRNDRSQLGLEPGRVKLDSVSRSKDGAAKKAPRPGSPPQHPSQQQQPTMLPTRQVHLESSKRLELGILSGMSDTPNSVVSLGHIAETNEDRVCFACRDGSVRGYNLPWLQRRIVQKDFVWHPHGHASVNQIQYSAYLDGFITASDDHTLQIIDGHGRSVRRFDERGHQRPVTGFAWADQTKVLASASPERTVLIWDRMAPAPVNRFSALSAPVSHVAIHEAAHQLVVTTQDNALRIYDLRTNSLLQAITEHDVAREHGNFSALGMCGSRIVAATDYPVAYLTRRELGSGSTHQYCGHLNTAATFAFNSHTNQLISVDTETAFTWSLDDGTPMFLFSITSFRKNLLEELRLTSITIDPSCRRIVTGFHRGVTVIWNASNGQPIAELNDERFTGHSVTATLAAVRQDVTFYVVAVGTTVMVCESSANQYSVKVRELCELPALCGRVITMVQVSENTIACGTTSAAVIFVNLLSMLVEGAPLLPPAGSTELHRRMSSLLLRPGQSARGNFFSSSDDNAGHDASTTGGGDASQQNSGDGSGLRCESLNLIHNLGPDPHVLACYTNGQVILWNTRWRTASAVTYVSTVVGFPTAFHLLQSPEAMENAEHVPAPPSAPPATMDCVGGGIGIPALVAEDSPASLLPEVHSASESPSTVVFCKREFVLVYGDDTGNIYAARGRVAVEQDARSPVNRDITLEKDAPPDAQLTMSASTLVCDTNAGAAVATVSAFVPNWRHSDGSDGALYKQQYALAPSTPATFIVAAAFAHQQESKLYRVTVPEWGKAASHVARMNINALDATTASMDGGIRAGSDAVVDEIGVCGGERWGSVATESTFIAKANRRGSVNVATGLAKAMATPVDRTRLTAHYDSVDLLTDVLVPRAKSIRSDRRRSTVISDPATDPKSIAELMVVLNAPQSDPDATIAGHGQQRRSLMSSMTAAAAADDENHHHHEMARARMSPVAGGLDVGSYERTTTHARALLSTPSGPAGFMPLSAEALLLAATSNSVVPPTAASPTHSAHLGSTFASIATAQSPSRPSTHQQAQRPVPPSTPGQTPRTQRQRGVDLGRLVPVSRGSLVDAEEQGVSPRPPPLSSRSAPPSSRPHVRMGARNFTPHGHSPVGPGKQQQQQSPSPLRSKSTVGLQPSARTVSDLRAPGIIRPSTESATARLKRVLIEQIGDTDDDDDTSDENDGEWSKIDASTRSSLGGNGTSRSNATTTTTTTAHGHSTGGGGVTFVAFGDTAGASTTSRVRLEETIGAGATLPGFGDGGHHHLTPQASPRSSAHPVTPNFAALDKLVKDEEARLTRNTGALSAGGVPLHRRVRVMEQRMRLGRGSVGSSGGGGGANNHHSGSRAVDKAAAPVDWTVRATAKLPPQDIGAYENADLLIDVLHDRNPAAASRAVGANGGRSNVIGRLVRNPETEFALRASAARTAASAASVPHAPGVRREQEAFSTAPQSRAHSRMLQPSGSQSPVPDDDGGH
jgi:WD40 repeat protein